MKLPIERLLKLIEPAMRLIKRAPEARDAFGGEDLFDGDSKPSGMGPKIALAASGVLFLSLLGLVGAFIFGGEEVEPAGVEGVVEESGDEHELRIAAHRRLRLGCSRREDGTLLGESQPEEEVGKDQRARNVGDHVAADELRLEQQPGEMPHAGAELARPER